MLWIILILLRWLKMRAADTGRPWAICTSFGEQVVEGNGFFSEARGSQNF